LFTPSDYDIIAVFVLPYGLALFESAQWIR